MSGKKYILTADMLTSYVGGYYSSRITNIIDGDINNSWQANASNGWILINLKKINKVGVIKIYPSIDKHDYTYHSISVSSDNTNYEVIGAMPSIKKTIVGEYNEYVINKDIQYIKLNFKTAGNGGYNYDCINEVEIFGLPMFYLLKQNDKFYTIKSDQYENGFKPLLITIPTKSDYETYGFNDLSLPFQNMTVGTETFRPIDKFDKSKPLEIYKCIEK